MPLNKQRNGSDGVAPAYQAKGPPPTETEARIQELDEQLNSIFKQAYAHTQHIDEKQAPHPNLPDALQEFIGFFTDYNAYFRKASTRQQIGNQVTYAHVLSTALENTRHVWITLGQAINQRFNPVYAENLKRADSRADELYQHCRAIMNVNKKPIVYFDKVYHITRYPYQSVPLIAVPLDRYTQDYDLILAHEIGHHVFWNNGELADYEERIHAVHEVIAKVVLPAQAPRIDAKAPEVAEKGLKTAFAEYYAWVGWAEEVFADIFGTLLSGPRYAKSIQDLLARDQIGRKEDLVHDDGEHPIPALRPLISLAVLRELAKRDQDEFGKQLAQLCEVLTQRWLPYWQAGKQVAPKVEARGSGELTYLPSLGKHIKALVSDLLTTQLFAPLGNEATSLLASVEYWGKAHDESELGEIQELLTVEPLPDLPTRRNGKNGGKMDKIQGEAPTDNAFGKLLAAVQKKQTKGQSDTEDWQEILYMDLALQHGHSDVRSHSHPVSHFHDTFGWKCFNCGVYL